MSHEICSQNLAVLWTEDRGDRSDEPPPQLSVAFTLKWSGFLPVTETSIYKYSLGLMHILADAGDDVFALRGTDEEEHVYRASCELAKCLR